MMFIYHLGNIEGINFGNSLMDNTLSYASYPVCFFLMVSGYGLYYAYKNGKLTLNYILKRSLRLYFAFWIVLLLFISIISSIFYPGNFSYPLKIHLLNIIGWRWEYCKFTWFLLPYIFMSLSSPWVLKMIDRLNPLVSVAVGIVTYLLTSFLISRFLITWLQSGLVLYHVMLWGQTLCSFIFGALLARRVKEGRSITWEKIRGNNYLIITLIVLLFVIRGQIHTSAVNPFYSFLMVWLIINMNIGGFMKSILMELGNKSMVMWFAHGFIAVRMFSEYFTLLHWPALIWLVWVIVSYIVAALLIPVINKTAEICLSSKPCG